MLTIISGFCVSNLLLFPRRSTISGCISSLLFRETSIVFVFVSLSNDLSKFPPLGSYQCHHFGHCDFGICLLYDWLHVLFEQLVIVERDVIIIIKWDVDIVYTQFICNLIRWTFLFLFKSKLVEFITHYFPWDNQANKLKPSHIWNSQYSVHIYKHFKLMEL